MRIITEPTVEVIAKSEFIGSTRFEIPDDGDSQTKIGAFAAKVCYDSNGKNGRANEQNQRAIIDHRHGSVMEHITVSLYITGITRGLTLELNRHRTFAISQRSTRYTAEEDASVVLDPFYATLYKKYGHFINNPVEDDISGVDNFNIDDWCSRIMIILKKKYSKVDLKEIYHIHFSPKIYFERLTNIYSQICGS